MLSVIIVIVLAVVGYFAYTMFIKPRMMGMAQQYTEALADFEANKETILEEYYADRDRFGLFKQVIPDEKIIGIVNYLQPKSVTKSIAGSIATGVTGIKKVNMDLYYLVLTDKNLHAIEFNGENSVDHTVFDLKEIQTPVVSKAGGLNLKDQITGTTGDLDKLKFNYKGEEYEYNLYRMMFGYPRFEAKKDPINGQYGYIYFYEGGMITSSNMMKKECQIDQMVKSAMYEGFKKQAAGTFRAHFPA